MLKCNGQNCACVKGIEWDDLIVTDQTLIIKGKYKFRLSVNLSNELEDLWLPLIQPKRLGQTWENRSLLQMFDSFNTFAIRQPQQ